MDEASWFTTPSKSFSIFFQSKVSFQRQLGMCHSYCILGPGKSFVHPYFVQGNKPILAYRGRGRIFFPTPEFDQEPLAAPKELSSASAPQF
jgi:hypothetical protein